MTSTELENLVAIGKLKREPCPTREYEGIVDVDERLMADLLVAAQAVLEAVRALDPPEQGHG